MSIGTRIRQKRFEIGITQEKLALKCGWESARGRISNYELDLHTPKLKDIQKLAKALNVEPQWLIFGND